MSRIRILPDALASQVAAGEVVERPAAVVRELLENSLDAGATHIEVQVQRGGTALIRISDNGHGMSREDALMSLERHATSKIRTKEDLGAIHTFGFRGEALPSIASVSRFRLATREPSSISGTEVEVQGGRLTDVRDYGGNHGTVIEARSLFYNVPARRKFLRTESTEFAHVEQQFRLHAIAHPNIAFTLVRDGAVTFHLPPTTNLLERIEGLCGRDLARRLLPLPATEHPTIKVTGYIGGAAVSRPNRQMQVTFLNGRPVDSPTISYALREGYHNAMMKGQYPVTFLFLEMAPESFDINVHPAKKEVRFHDGHSVREAVVQAVAQTINQSTIISSGHLPSSRTTAAEALHPQPSLIPEAQQISLRNDWSSIPTSTTTTTTTTTTASDETANATASMVPKLPPQAPSSAPVNSLPPQASSPPNTASNQADQFRILGVLHKLYVLMESAEGLVLMDQHAAHERVLYEQLRHAMEHEGVPSQRLLLPLNWEVSPRDYDLLCQHLATLNKLGIEAGPFGNNAFKIDALPAFLKTDDPIDLLRQVVDELAGSSSRTSALRLGEDMIATTVCRAAVKANDRLREPELRKLLEDLFACEMPYCCPHGRPTLIQITLPELEKKFGRRAP
jgi:DNA mismatch repair protein MutL